MRAVVLQQGSCRVAWVVADLIGLFSSTLDRVRARPEVRALGLDPLLLTCTHTHAGPDSLGFWTPGGGGPAAGLLEQVEDAIVDALGRAAGRLVPVHAATREARAPEWMRSCLPPFATDDRLRSLHLASVLDGQGVATLVHWGNHAEALGPDQDLLSADFPGALCAALEEAWGGTACFLPGPIGGLVTPRGTLVRDPDSGRTVGEGRPGRAAALGRLLARRLRSAPPTSPEEPPGLQAWRRRFSVAVTQPGMAARTTERARPRFQDDRRSRVETECVLLRVGGLRILTTPGEPCPELVLGGVAPSGGGRRWELPALEDLWPGPLWVVSLTNDALGYAVPHTQWPEDPARVILSPGPGFAASLVRAAQAMAAAADGKEIPGPRPLRPLAGSRR